MRDVPKSQTATSLTSVTFGIEAFNVTDTRLSKAPFVTPLTIIHDS